MRVGNLDAARQAFEAAIRLQPSFERAYIDLADLFRTQGDEAKAR
jgi:Tfp pilus assembly protein PilF